MSQTCFNIINRRTYITAQTLRNVRVSLYPSRYFLKAYQSSYQQNDMLCRASNLTVQKGYIRVVEKRHQTLIMSRLQITVRCYRQLGILHMINVLYNGALMSHYILCRVSDLTVQKGYIRNTARGKEAQDADKEQTTYQLQSVIFGN